MTPTATAYTTRQLRATDATSFYEAVRASLPELADWMPWCSTNYSLADATAWISFTEAAWSERSEFPLAIVERSSGAIVGGTGINQINSVHRTGNIGYWVSKPHTGRGVAQLAAKEAAALGFGELGLCRLEIVTLTHNIASQRVAEAIGATRECVARNRLQLHGQPQDAVVYSLIPGDAVRWG